MLYIIGLGIVVSLFLCLVKQPNVKVEQPKVKPKYDTYIFYNEVV